MMRKPTTNEPAKVICNSCKHLLPICSAISCTADKSEPFMGVCELTLEKVFLFNKRICKDFILETNTERQWEILD